MTITVTMKRRSCAQKGVVMNNLWSECVEQNDAKEKVLHRIHGELDGVKYKIQFTAPCPMTAIKIARFIPLVYWEME